MNSHLIEGYRCPCCLRSARLFSKVEEFKARRARRTISGNVSSLDDSQVLNFSFTGLTIFVFSVIRCLHKFSLDNPFNRLLLLIAIIFRAFSMQFASGTLPLLPHCFEFNFFSISISVSAPSRFGARRFWILINQIRLRGGRISATESSLLSSA